MTPSDVEPVGKDLETVLPLDPAEEETPPIEDNNLYRHAERELKLLGNDVDYDEQILEIVKAFIKMGHSGGSAAYTIPLISKLLSYENLTPLTDDPDEWEFHGEHMVPGSEGFWQNRRNSEAFSMDGGKTYYLLSEGGNSNNPNPSYKTNTFKTDIKDNK